MNVAADTFVQLSHMELIGGMIVVLGDDPGANSSQNEQDNRHFARLSFTPLFEPASPAETYAMFKEAARISSERKVQTTHFEKALQDLMSGTTLEKNLELFRRLSKI